MALRVGNLLLDMTANSFISSREADFYLGDEIANPAIEAWIDADSEVKETSLVKASRWMAENLLWNKTNLTEAEMMRIGRAAARMAVAIVDFDPYAMTDPSKTIKRVKADTVEVEYADPAVIGGADGSRWPWLAPMLRGLIRSNTSDFGIGILVV